MERWITSTYSTQGVLIKISVRTSFQEGPEFRVTKKSISNRGTQVESQEIQLSRGGGSSPPVSK